MGVAMAGQSTATYSIESRAGSSAIGSLQLAALDRAACRYRHWAMPLPPARNSRGQLTRPQQQGADPLVD